MISNRTSAHERDFESTRMISDQIALHSVQLPLFISQFKYINLIPGREKMATKKYSFVDIYVTDCNLVYLNIISDIKLKRVSVLFRVTILDSIADLKNIILLLSFVHT